MSVLKSVAALLAFPFVVGVVSCLGSRLVLWAIDTPADDLDLFRVGVLAASAVAFIEAIILTPYYVFRD